MAFEWVVRLNDFFSSPAERVEKSIRATTRALRDLQAQEKEMAALKAYSSGNQLKGDILMRQVELASLRNQKSALRDSGTAVEFLKDRMKDARQWARDWLLILTPLAQGLHFVADRALSAGRSLKDAIGTRQDARIGFEAAFGSNSEAMLKMVQDLALRTGRPVGELFKEASNFGNLGAPESEIRAMLLALSDAKAMGLEFGKLNTVFEASLSKPVGTLREISEGLRGVVDETKLWKHLAEDVGKALGRPVNIGEVGQLYKERRIGAGFVRQAVLETLQDREGGKLGLTQFKQADTTLNGSFNKFEQRLTNLFANVERTKGFKTFKQAFDNLSSLLTEKRTQKIIDDMANAFGRFLEPLTGKEGKKRMEDFFDSLTKKIDSLVSRIEKFGRVYEGLKISVGLGEKPKELTPKKTLELTKKLESDLGLDKVSPVEAAKNYFRKKFGIAAEDLRSSANEFAKTFSPEEEPKSLEKEPEKKITISGGIHIHQTLEVKGASKEDVHSIAKAAKDATVEGLVDAFDKMNVETP